MSTRNVAAIAAVVGAAALAATGITYASATTDTTQGAPVAPAVQAAPAAPAAAPMGGEGRDEGDRHDHEGMINFNERTYSAHPGGCITVVSGLGSNSFNVRNDSDKSVEVFRGATCDNGAPVATVGPHSSANGVTNRFRDGFGFGGGFDGFDGGFGGGFGGFDGFDGFDGGFGGGWDGGRDGGRDGDHGEKGHHHRHHHFRQDPIHVRDGIVGSFRVIRDFRHHEGHDKW